MRDMSKVLGFGIYRDIELTNPAISLHYIKWLTDRGSYPEPDNRFRIMWKVPIEISILARREWERRTGLRWEG